MSRALRLKKIDAYGNYPLQQLYDDDLKIILSSGMPALYQSSLTDELIAANEECGLGVDEVEEMMLNGVQLSFLDAEEKQAMIEAFKAELSQLRESQLIEN
jgi:adenosine deaminase